ncbi:MAG: PepSY domain-containing protein [Verrucomicrobia bacterium]|nr:PepSY domain-containing protein [Verrucomicrobiota bacterium]MDE3098412.1 PepSY domain-containing protein [Verrucomicrobiota bacterium]
MKSKHIVGMVAVAAIATVFASSAFAGENENDQSALQARAKVSKADAEQTALTKAPNGTLKEGELEMEKGILIWSFGFATPGSQDTTEVNVDAVSGRVVSMEWEMPEAQAKQQEKAELAAMAKISKTDAQQIASGKVPNGTVKEAELELEKGILIWSFGFATPDSKDTTEVNVDAVTGRVVNMEWETSSNQAQQIGNTAGGENDNADGDND